MNIKDIIKLDDLHEYVVCNKVYYNGKTYYFLMDINNPANIKICYLSDEYLVEEMDREFTNVLLQLFAKNITGDRNEQ